MRNYVDRVTAAITGEPRRAGMTPRRARPRRARTTFVPVQRTGAFAR
jgi:hypothetical protein